jgi:radical SAM protein with 4Fe4S-binding SPASM domain
MLKKIKEELKRSRLFIGVYSRLPSYFLKKRKIVAVSIEISSMCNLHCVFCPVGNGRIVKELMTLENHKKIIDLLPKNIKELRYNLRGDPTLNKDFVKMIKYAHNQGFKTLVSTNGMAIAGFINELVESGLDRIFFAVDGATQEVQSKYRVGSDLERIKGNIKMLVVARNQSVGKFPKEIIFQVVVSKHNEKQVEDLQKMAKDLGVDKIKFKTMAVNMGSQYIQSRESQEEFLPKNKAYWRSGRDILLCPALGETVILYNGDVSICCSDVDGKYIMGNVLEENSFEKVVYGRKYNEIRKRIIKKSLPICKDCPITGHYWISEISKNFKK